MNDPEAKLTMPCRTCKEPILQGARKCIHCDAAQDWHRYLGLSSSVLALLIALISVLTTAVPILSKYIAGNHSELELDFQTADGGAVYIAATNSGNRAGRIGYATLQLHRETAHFPLVLNPERAFVGPGEHKPLKFNLDRDYDSQLTQDVTAMFPQDAGRVGAIQTIVLRDHVPATIRFQVIQFGGACSLVTFQAELSCGNLACSISKPEAMKPTARPKMSPC